jgi:hypothetical protein
MTTHDTQHRKIANRAEETQSHSGRETQAPGPQGRATRAEISNPPGDRTNKERNTENDRMVLAKNISLLCTSAKKPAHPESQSPPRYNQHAIGIQPIALTEENRRTIRTIESPDDRRSVTAGHATEGEDGKDYVENELIFVSLYLDERNTLSEYTEEEFANFANDIEAQLDLKIKAVALDSARRLWSQEDGEATDERRPKGTYRNTSLVLLLDTVGKPMWWEKKYSSREASAWNKAVFGAHGPRTENVNYITARRRGGAKAAIPFTFVAPGAVWTKVDPEEGAEAAGATDAARIVPRNVIAVGVEINPSARSEDFLNCLLSDALKLTSTNASLGQRFPTPPELTRLPNGRLQKANQLIKPNERQGIRGEDARRKAAQSLPGGGHQGEPQGPRRQDHNQKAGPCPTLPPLTQKSPRSANLPPNLEWSTHLNINWKHVPMEHQLRDAVQKVLNWIGKVLSESWYPGDRNMKVTFTNQSANNYQWVAARYGAEPTTTGKGGGKGRGNKGGGKGKGKGKGGNIMSFTSQGNPPRAP